jgi:hypothetical protein
MSCVEFCLYGFVSDLFVGFFPFHLKGLGYFGKIKNENEKMIKMEERATISQLEDSDNIQHITMCSTDSYPETPVRIGVRIGPSHPLVCRKRRLNGAALRTRSEKPMPRVTVGVAR